MARAALVAANITAYFAALACGMAFFAPYWLINVRPDEPGSGNGTYLNAVRFISKQKDETYTRGLWAECGRLCQWFWEYNNVLQDQLFTPLKWHLAAQILYFIGCTLVLATIFMSQLQFCCHRERIWVVRALGITMLTSFCIQTGAVAAFGGGAWSDYGAKSSPVIGVDWSLTNETHYGWCFWMTLAGGGLTLVSGVLYLIHDCCAERTHKD